MTFSLPCLGMTRALRVRQTYDHRLRDAIAATGNANLFRKRCDPGIDATHVGAWRGAARGYFGGR